MEDTMTERLIAVTHSGKFHADEVFGTAVLRTLYPELEVVRSRDPDVMRDADFVYDVGGIYDHNIRRYDHHQLGARKRNNGLTYSAFGLIWLHYGLDYCGGDEGVHKAIDDQLVRGIDAGDNAERVETPDPRAAEYGISQVIEQLNPIPGSGESYDGQFSIAVERASSILSRLYTKTKVQLEGASEILAAHLTSPNRRYVVMDHLVELSDTVSEISDLDYVVFPEPVNQTWQVFAVPVLGEPFAQKHPLPQEWAGLMNEALAKVSEVPDAMFCHKNRFLAVAKSREGALALLAKALQ